MKVVILGKGEMLANLIRGTLLAHAEIVGVFRYESLLYNPFQLFCHDLFHNSPELTLIKKHKIKDLKFRSANSDDFRKFLIKNNIDIALVGTWREKISKETFIIPKIGMINAHPSLLPKYRGPNPYLQTIWHGEKKSGITFHLMDEKFDAGAILAQAEVDILDGDTSYELKNRTVFKARLLCAELLKKLKNGAVEPIIQDETGATYYKNIDPIDMTLDFSKETAEEICAHVRAFHSFLPTYIQTEKGFYVVNPYKISVVDMEQPSSKHSLTIMAKDGKYVKFEGLRRYGKQ